MIRRIITTLCLALIFCLTAVSSLAAEIPAELETEHSPAPLQEVEQRHNLPSMQATPPVTIYPAEIQASEDQGVYILKKVYYLQPTEDPANIPTEDFERDGRHYTLLDILKEDMTETDSREYSEVVQSQSKTKDKAKIQEELEPEMEVTTEDGYAGVLTANFETMKVEASGYGTSSWTATAQRTYPSLSGADLSLIPKTTEENGKTLTLADVDWKENLDGEGVATSYTAVATYTGVMTGQYATGYTVSVEYSGTVTRVSNDLVMYTAIFESYEVPEPEPTPEPTPDPTPDATQEPTPEPTGAPEQLEAVAQRMQTEESQQDNQFRRVIVLTLVIILVLAILVYGVYLLIKLTKKS